MPPTPKRTTAPAFQFYPKDFLSSTKVQRMSLTEVGAYIVLLSHCWLNDGLPSDQAQLARIVKVPTSQFARMWKGPLSECFYLRDGTLHHERLDVERKKQHEYRRRQTDNGGKGGRPKKKPLETQKKPMGFENETQPEPTQNLSYLQTTSVPPNPPDGGPSSDDVHVSPAVSEAAGLFVEGYARVYQKARNGAFYAAKPNRDWGYACQLLKAWPDAEYLLKMAELFLLKDAWKPKNEPGTVGQFLHMAPQCDAELRKHGIVPRPSKVASWPS